MPAFFRLSVAVIAVFVAMVGCAPGRWDSFGDPLPAGYVSPDTIYRLVTTLPPRHWLNLDPAMDPRPEGFRFNLYLWTREAGIEKSVKTNGLLQAQMYEMVKTKYGTARGEMICDWTQDLKDVPQTETEQAVGWGYQPHLHWGNVDVYGREVQVVIWFEERNGRKVGGRPISLRIPSGGVRSSVGVVQPR